MSDNKESNIIESFGLLTTIWGPSTWEALHCITFGYSENPSDNDKNNYYNFFQSLAKVLPCCVCRDHYSKFIMTNGETKLDKETVMTNKETLTKWLWTLHCNVNKKLGIVYDITYDDLCNKYKSYITNCQLTQKEKQIPYKHYYNREAPIIQHSVATCFIGYAETRGVENFKEHIDNIKNIKKDNYKNSDEWIKRNEECNNIIKDMRLKGIPCVEESGVHEGLPTISELQLMKHLSTTMSQKHIMKILNKLGYVLKK